LLLSSPGEMIPESGELAPSFFILGSVRYTLALPNPSDRGHVAKVQELYRHMARTRSSHGTVWSGSPVCAILPPTCPWRWIECRSRRSIVSIAASRYGRPTAQPMRTSASLRSRECCKPPVLEGFSYRDSLACQGL
jgi:hypothetical protein